MVHRYPPRIDAVMSVAHGGDWQAVSAEGESKKVVEWLLREGRQEEAEVKRLRCS
jgi:hypothetical protein